jgi:hypothetical protein
MATAAEALRKLTGGQTLTNEEKKLLNISTTPSSIDATRSFYEGMGSSKFTPPVLPDEEPLPEMPSDKDMAAAEDVYQDARKVLNLPPDTTKKSDTGVDSDEMKNRISAYDVLRTEFAKYGLESLVTDARDLLINRTPASQISLALANTDAYKKRFSANQDRIKAGFRALSPAEYISKEDAIQDIFLKYGMPASYYSKDSTGKQENFDKLIAYNIDDAQIEERVATAQKRVLNTNPEVLKALRQFYPDINTADILAYTLDPKNAIENINRKVTAAEIGGAALAQGLQALGGTAESLAGQGITKAQAQAGYTNVAEILPRGSQLADIYGEEPYTQQTAEAEVFGTAGAAEAAKKRKKLTGLETAAFSGSSGVGALGRDRANSQTGAGAF